MDKSIALLKKIIKDDTMLLQSINNIEPATFKSVRIFYNEIGSDENIEEAYNHFVRALKELNPYKEGIEFVSTEGDIQTLKVLGHEFDIYNTAIVVSSVKGLKNDYEITTYSPFYSYFVLKNHQWILEGNHGNISILNRYSNVFDMIDKWEITHKQFGNNDYTTLTAIANKLLFYYLVESQLAFRYKYYVYEYVKKFLDEFDNNFPQYKKQDSMAVKDFYIMHLIDTFAQFSRISVFTTKDFCDCIYEIFIELALKHETSNDKEANKVTEFEKELLSVFNEISDYSNNLEFKETVPPKEGIRRVMDEIYETNDYNIKSKLIPYWYNIQYVVNTYNNTKTNNHKDLLRNGLSYAFYRKNFPFNEYYLYEAMLNRPKI